MKTRTWIPLLFAAATLVGAPLSSGCGGGGTVVLAPEIQRGPAHGVRPNKVLALSASCGSMELSCPHRYIETVDGIVRSSLDFAGYAVVQPDQLRAETRQRHEVHEREREGSQSSGVVHEERTLGFDRTTTSARESVVEREKSTVVLDGPGFDDLTTNEKRAVLSDAGADAVLAVRVVIGAQHGVWSPDQAVEVMVKLGMDEGRQMAVASRCVASSNDFATVEAALEHATRCAVAGVTNQ
jgi:hypothetical protein